MEQACAVHSVQFEMILTLDVRSFIFSFVTEEVCPPHTCEILFHTNEELVYDISIQRSEYILQSRLADHHYYS